MNLKMNPSSTMFNNQVILDGFQCDTRIYHTSQGVLVQCFIFSWRERNHMKSPVITVAVPERLTKQNTG